MLFSRQERITMPRITVSFERNAAKRLERLSQDRSKSDVIREALALEEIFQMAMAEGATLIFRTKDGEERQIIRA